MKGLFAGPLRPASVSEAAPLPGSIGFGRVRHRRLRPHAHAFSYPALFLRLPVRDLGLGLGGSRLIAHNRWNVFSFHDCDHGARDGGSLAQWMDQLLLGEGVSDARGVIWLHTFPRVLGYVFNPVSFWYCHRVDGALRAIVVEVNNTFKESHCYLLSHPDGRPLRFGEEIAARKVLHVSPFCRIEGQYRFRFLTSGQRVVMRIEYDDREGPLLLTSLSGDLRPISDASLAAAFFRFPLFTLGVIVRIHWQAIKLWVKRVPYISKPVTSSAKATR
ncbi:MAG: DUF1365 domain-containing protein [Burkholderiaceae bacterium]|jgi:DUF1365 family protein